MPEVSDIETDTADRVMRCLQTIALEKGLDALSMRDVARRAEITLASLQYHFPTKAALIDAFVHRIVAALQRAIQSVLDSADTTPKLAKIVYFVLEETIDDPENTLIGMIWARACHDRTSRAALADLMVVYIGGVRDVLRADYNGISEPQALLAATLIVSMLEGMATSYETALTLGTSPKALTIAAFEAADEIAKRFQMKP